MDPRLKQAPNGKIITSQTTVGQRLESEEGEGGRGEKEEKKMLKQKLFLNDEAQLLEYKFYLFYEATSKGWNNYRCIATEPGYMGTMLITMWSS